MKEPAQIISKAIVTLIRRNPFLGFSCSLMDRKQDGDSIRINDGPDGGRPYISYNPDFIMEVRDPSRIACMLHCELMERMQRTGNEWKV